MQMKILQVVQEHMAQKAMGGTASPAPAPSGGGDDTVAKLERLAALKDSGAITEKEFEREKQKLLGG
jgi:Short C-terminal domain